MHSENHKNEHAQHAHPDPARPDPAELQPGPGNEALARNVQRSVVHQVLGTAGQPLPGALRAEMESRMGEDFSGVRMHDDAAARDSARSVGARAYTSGEHIVLGDGGGDRHTLAHELTHVVQQRNGPVAGTDNGDGLSVSDPSDRFERAAEANARRVMSGGTPVARSVAPSSPPGNSLAVQGFYEVAPGQEGYPTFAGPGPNFPGQEARPRAVTQPGQQPEVKDSYVDDQGQINLVNQTEMSLRISDNLDLAIENTGNGRGNGRQAKAFFASQNQMDAANQKLSQAGSPLQLTRTGTDMLLTVESTTITLHQVMPALTRQVGFMNPQPVTTTGLDVRTAQRCDEIAREITRQSAPAMRGEEAYIGNLIKVVRKLYLVNGRLWERDYKKAYDKASEDASQVGALSAAIAKMIQGILAYRDGTDSKKRELEKAYRELGINQNTADPVVGDLFMVKALRNDASSGSVDFHFASVVATSGSDYITMENLARREETATLSSGDPQWYFQMYGSGAGKTFHEQTGWVSRFGAGSTEGNRLVMTIRLRGGS